MPLFFLTAKHFRLSWNIDVLSANSLIQYKMIQNSISNKSIRTIDEALTDTTSQ